MQAVLDALLRPEFFRGLLFGGIGALLALIISLLARRRHLPLAGIVVSVAFLAAATRLPSTVLLGVLLLAVVGIVGDRWPERRWFVPLLSIVAATVLMVPGGAIEPVWAMIGGVMAVVFGAMLVADFDVHHADSRVGPLLLAGSVFGVFSVVPDTELAVTLLGCVLPIALLSLVASTARIGIGGAYSVVGVIVWVVLRDGSTRTSALIGGIAALGILAIEPVARRIAGAGRPLTDPVLVAVDILLLVLATRLAGTLESTANSLAIVALVTAATVGLIVLYARSGQPSNT